MSTEVPEVTSKYFAVFDKATGKVLRTGYCGIRDFFNQAGEGEEVIEVVEHLNPNEHVVDLSTKVLTRKQ